VWLSNFFESMDTIERFLAADYNYIAMDTEFPGTVYVPTNKDSNEFIYQMIRGNCDNLKLI